MSMACLEAVANWACAAALAVLEVYEQENCIANAAEIGSYLLNELKERGLEKVHLFVSDGLKSLEKAVSKVFNQSIHQKCIVHLQRNILASVRSSHKAEIAADLRAVLNPDDKTNSLLLRSVSVNFPDFFAKATLLL